MLTLGEMATVFHLACDDVKGHGAFISRLLKSFVYLFVCVLVKMIVLAIFFMFFFI